MLQLLFKKWWVCIAAGDFTDHPEHYIFKIRLKYWPGISLWLDY